MELPAFLLGTAVRIRTNISITNPTSVTITIKTSAHVNVAGVVDVPMTKVSSTGYEYIWQTAAVPTMLEDEYDIFITVVSGGYTTIASETISMLDAQNRHNIPDNLK